MYQYSIFEWMAFFYVYCFAGWCFESGFVSITKKKLVNRGFLRGPFLPLYGTGAIMMLLVSAPFQSKIFLTFCAGCVGATVLEYITAVLMEALFKVRYWDYSNQMCNFQGRICLSSTIAWGVLTIFMTRLLHPYTEKLIRLVPKNALSLVVMLVTVGILVDFILSFKAALELRNILEKIAHFKEECRKEIGALQKRLDVVIAVVNDTTGDKLFEFRKQLIDLYMNWAFLDKMSKNRIAKAIKHFYRRSMLRDNPTINSPKFGESLNSMKKTILTGKKKANETEMYDDEVNELVSSSLKDENTKEQDGKH